MKRIPRPGADEFDKSVQQFRRRADALVRGAELLGEGFTVHLEYWPPVPVARIPGRRYDLHPEPMKQRRAVWRVVYWRAVS